MKLDSNQMQQQQQQQRSPPIMHQQQQVPGNSLVTHNSGNFFSSFSSDLNGIASSTSSMFSDLFGKSK